MIQQMLQGPSGEVSSMRVAFLLCVATGCFVVAWSTIKQVPVNWEVLMILFGGGFVGKVTQKGKEDAKKPTV